MSATSRGRCPTRDRLEDDDPAPVRNTRPVPVLVVNAGSTSLKLSLVDSRDESEQLDSLDAALGRATAVGHRVVHGGRQYRQPVLIDDDVERDLSELTALAPLHNGPAVEAIRAG